MGAVEQEHEVVLASFVRTLDAQHFTAIVLSRSLDAEFLQQHGQALGQTLTAETGTDVCALPSPKSLTVMAGAPSKPVHLSALKEATT